MKLFENELEEKLADFLTQENIAIRELEKIRAVKKIVNELQNTYFMLKEKNQDQLIYD